MSTGLVYSEFLRWTSQEAPTIRAWLSAPHSSPWQGMPRRDSCLCFPPSSCHSFRCLLLSSIHLPPLPATKQPAQFLAKWHIWSLEILQAAWFNLQQYSIVYASWKIPWSTIWESFSTIGHVKTTMTAYRSIIGNVCMSLRHMLDSNAYKQSIRKCAVIIYFQHKHIM